MKIKIKILKACDENCNALAELKKQIWETTYRGIYPTAKFDNFSIKEESEKFLNMIHNPNLQLFIVKVENKIIGYVAIGKSPRRENLEQNEIVLLYLLKEFQGCGIGKQIFNFAIDMFRKMNLEYFIVYCNKYNKNAQAFYKKMGCEIISIDEDNEDMSLPQVKFIYHY